MLLVSVGGQRPFPSVLCYALYVAQTPAPREPKAVLGKEVSALCLKGSRKRLDGTPRGASIG